MSSSNLSASKAVSSQSQPRNTNLSPRSSQVHIRPSLRRSGNLLLDLPIAGRLTLGFLTAALIATLAAGLIGALRSQSLSRQSNFYQNLLQTNTSLNTGANFLELMNTEMNTVVTVAAQQTSQETLTNDQHAVLDLSNRYNQVLGTYFASSLVEEHPDEVALLNEASHSGQIEQQRTLAASTLRTWDIYQAAQNQILRDIATHQFADAQALLRVQAEPTNADAQSALRSLIQFDQHLAQSIQDAASIEEQQQIITTIIGSILAFLLIALVGWLISSTLVKRLKQLRRVTRLVENGQLDARVAAIGRDEIADVSASINAMLDAIVGLIEETRHQRDALTNAAEHLFTDMRVVSAGDLRINAPVGNDPIGMLANAFNFTVGRFRRFVLRTQTTIEQVEVITRQGIERSENFAMTLSTLASPSSGGQHIMPSASNARSRIESGQNSTLTLQDRDLLQNIQTLRERLQKLHATEGFSRHMRAITSLTEQISLTANRLIRAIPGQNPEITRTPSGNLAQLHIQELHTLETMLQRLMLDLQGVQRSTANDLLELDNGLAQLSNSLHTARTTTTETQGTQRTKELSPEMIRQGQSFASDIIALARKLTALTQEMRNAVIAFQLDTNESGMTIEPTNSPYSLPFSSSTQHNLADMAGRSAPLPPLRENVPPPRPLSR